MNSSYVLIENASFRSRLGTEVFTPYRLPWWVYYIVEVQICVDFMRQIAYNMLNKGAVSQMKPDRRQSNNLQK